MTSLRGPVLGLVAIAAVAAAGVAVRPPAGHASRPMASTAPVDAVALVCPDLSGGSLTSTTMTVADVAAALRPRRKPTARVTYAPLTGPHATPVRISAKPVAAVTRTTFGHPVVVRATGQGAADVAADQMVLVDRGRLRSLASTACLPPVTDTWLTGADGRVGYDDYLFVANPGSTRANITVTGWSTKGALSPPKLESYTLGPGRAAYLSVASYAPDAADITFHVHANAGRVAAEVLEHRFAGLAAAGSDYIAPTLPPSRHLTIPGFPGGPGYRYVVLANPTGGDATVGLRLVTSTGAFVPAGHQTVVVPAGRAVTVELSRAFAGVAGAAQLTSDVPVVASGLSQETASGLLSEVQWQPAGAPLRGAAVLVTNAPPFGTARLLLTAPDQTARVRLTTPSGRSVVMSIPAGRTLGADPVHVLGSVRSGHGPIVFTPVGNAPIYVSRTFYALGAHGTLVTAEQPMPLPGPILLPPVVQDPRAAVR